MSNILSFSPSAYVEAVSAATTRAARQAAIVTRQGTGTQTVTIRDGDGVAKLTGTFAGTALASSGALLPRTALASVSGAGGTPTSAWTVEIANASGDKLTGGWGSSAVWVYSLGGVSAATLDPAASSTFITLTLAADVAPPSTDDYLANNIVLSTTPPANTAGANEAEVLWSGRRIVKLNLFWVSAYDWPWEIVTLPPENDLYGGEQWHGGWYYWGATGGAKWVHLPDALPGSSRVSGGVTEYKQWHRGSPGTMLQFMVKDYAKASAWTDADYYWTDFDRWIDAHAAKGKKVIFQWFLNITGGNITSFSGTTVPSVSVERLKDAIQRVAQRTTAGGNAASDVILLWEGPNEPNSAGGDGDTWSWLNQVGTMTVTNLAENYRIASQCLKAVRPNALIAGPIYSGMGTWENSKVQRFLEASASGRDAGYGTGSGTFGRDWVDVVDTHGYRVQGQTNVADYAAAFRDLVAKQALGGAGGKPLVISEWMAFDGAWPSFSESPGEEDRWQWFNHISMAIAYGVQAHVHFTYKAPDRFGDPRIAAVATRRAWRNAVVQWLLDGEIVRVVRTTGNTVRVTMVKPNGAVQTRETRTF
jgi:hypothetical protein